MIKLNVFFIEQSCFKLICCTNLKFVISARTAVGCWLNSYQTQMHGAHILFHLPHERLKFAACHVELLLDLVALLGLLPRLELTPQSLKGFLLSLPAL